jgi:uncharacterized OsmC-like protein
VPAGFADIRLHYEIDAPGVEPAQLETLIEKTERYCTVLQTLRRPPAVDVQMSQTGQGWPKPLV